MKVKNLAFACGMGIVGVGVVNTAEAQQHVYATVEGGIAQHPDANYSSNATDITGTWSYKQGWGIGGSVGVFLPRGFRAEGELVYRSNDLNTVSITGIGQAPISGNSTSTAIMVNGFYDFLRNQAVNPYLGVGIGVSNDHFEANASGISASSDEEEFAYQFIAGVQFRIDPRLSIAAEYRYFATTEPGYESGGGTMKTDYDTNNGFVALQWKF